MIAAEKPRAEEGAEHKGEACDAEPCGFAPAPTRGQAVMNQRKVKQPREQCENFLRIVVP